MVQIGRIVQPVNLVAWKFFEQAVLDHGTRAAEAFFGRLEDEMHGAVEIPGLREVARGAQQHGGMAVMAAAVEAAGNGRAPSQVSILFHRQRVHVGAQAYALATTAFALEHADHAGAAETAVHLDAPLREPVGNDPGSADFLEADFGMRVQIPADRGEFVGKGFDAVDVGHLIYPMAEEGERDLTAGAKAGTVGLDAQARTQPRPRQCGSTRDVRLVIARSASNEAIRFRIAANCFWIAMSAPHGEEALLR